MKRLVLLVEATSDRLPVANLAYRILDAHRPEAHGEVFIDGDPLVIGNVPDLSGRTAGPEKWRRMLTIAARRPAAGGLLVVVDGDEERFEGGPFCPRDVARTLAARGTEVGAGTLFSLAVVILRQEFESLLIAAASQLSGFDGSELPSDIEAAPRDAKRWLTQHLNGGYKESADQLSLTQQVKDFTPLRTLRCYRRLEKAVVQLVDGMISSKLVSTPAAPPPAPPA